MAGLHMAYDLVYINHGWIRDRRLNGAETGHGSDHYIQLRFTEDKIGVKTAKVFYYEKPLDGCNMKVIVLLVFALQNG